MLPGSAFPEARTTLHCTIADRRPMPDPKPRADVVACLARLKN